MDIISGELERLGYTVETVCPAGAGVSYCAGCFGCWVKTPGNCLINDRGREIAEEIIRCQLLVIYTPVTFGGYSPEVKKAIERMIPNISPFFMKINGEVHHKPRYKRYPGLICIGVLPGPDPESELIFKTLAGRNAINFHAPAHSAGVIFKSQEAGEMREKVRAILAGAGVA